jgi:hypothetical protein
VHVVAEAAATDAVGGGDELPGVDLTGEVAGEGGGVEGVVLTGEDAVGDRVRGREIEGARFVLHGGEVYRRRRTGRARVRRAGAHTWDHDEG